jgi:hypothetical protein
VLNHARTLLLNVPGTAVPSDLYPGDEAIAPNYAPVMLPDAVSAVHDSIFGLDPDQVFLNYRAMQLMRLIHATPLADHVTALDPRISYDLNEPTFFGNDLFAPVGKFLSGSAGSTLTITGTPIAPDIRGRMRWSFIVTVNPAGIATVAQTTKPFLSPVTPFTVTGGLSEPIHLDDSGYSIQFNSVQPQQWFVEFLNRPARGPADILAALETIGEPVLEALFGVSPAEPFKTFKTLWFNNHETPLRLASIILAAIYRTEEQRPK